MGERRAGLNRVAFRRVGGTGASASSSLAPWTTYANDTWYVWGQPPGRNSYGNTTTAIGNNVNGGRGGSPSVPRGMLAIPHWFPEAGQITLLVMPQFPGNYGAPVDFGWLGIAPNTFVGGVPYPGATAVSQQCVQPAGLAAAGNLYINGGAVNYSHGAGALLWLVFQTAPAFPNNSCYLGTDGRDVPNIFGTTDCVGITINTPGGGFSQGHAVAYAGLVGWHTGTGIASGPVYVVGQDFPAGQSLFGNVGPYCIEPGVIARGQNDLPVLLFQWERS